MMYVAAAVQQILHLLLFILIVLFFTQYSVNLCGFEHVYTSDSALLKYCAHQGYAFLGALYFSLANTRSPSTVSGGLTTCGQKR